MLLEQIEHKILSDTSFPIDMKADGKDPYDVKLVCDMQVRGKITVYIRKAMDESGEFLGWKVTDAKITHRYGGHLWREEFDEVQAICIRNSVQEHKGELFTIIDTSPYTSLCCLLCAIIEIRARTQS